MSVLNQMLRDLEQRQAPARPGLELAAAGAPAASPLLVALAPSTLPLAKPLEPTPLAALAQDAMATHAAAGMGRARASGARLRAIVWSVVFACVAATTAALEWAERQQVVRAPEPLGVATYGGALATGNAVVSDPNMRPANAPAATVAAAPAVTGTAATSREALVTTEPRPRSAMQIAAGQAAPVAVASRPASTATTVQTSAARSAVPRKTPPAELPQATTASPAAASAPAVAPTATATNDAAPAVRRSAASEADPQADLARASALIARGRASEAKEILNAVLARQPAQADARAALAALQAEAGDRRAALATLQAGAALDPQRFALPAAQLQNELGDAAGARQTLERVPPARRSGAQHALAAGLALAAQQPAAAISAYQRALASDESNAVWWVGLALAHEADGDAFAAREAFMHAARSPALDAELRAFVAQRLAALPASAGRATGNAPLAGVGTR